MVKSAETPSDRRRFEPGSKPTPVENLIISNSLSGRLALAVWRYSLNQLIPERRSQVRSGGGDVRGAGFGPRGGLPAAEGGMGQLEAERRRDRLERLLVCWPSTRIVDVACPMVALAQFAA